MNTHSPLISRWKKKVFYTVLLENKHRLCEPKCVTQFISLSDCLLLLFESFDTIPACASCLTSFDMRAKVRKTKITVRNSSTERLMATKTMST